MKNSAVSSWNADKTRKLVLIAMLAAVQIVLQVSGIGYLPIPGLNPTLMHIPVIIGAIVLGPAAGAFLGFVFGMTSMIQAPIQSPLTAFLFNPFVAGGSWKSLVVAFVPRILVGIVAAYTFRLICRWDKNGVIASLLAGITGSLTNTVLVLGGIYIFFRDAFAKVNGIPAGTVMKVLAGVVATSGLAEAAVAAVIGAAVARALFVFLRRSRRTKT